MIGMQMTQEDLVEVIVGYLHGCDALGRSGPDIEEKLVAVSQFEQPARRCLFGTRCGHAGSAGDQAHFVRREVLAVGRVEITSAPLHR